MDPRPFLLQDLPRYLDGLQADTPAQWGKMSAQHMLEHLFNVVTVSRKELGLPCVTPPAQQAAEQQWIWNDAPFAPGFKGVGVPEDPPALRFED
jgi:hypothetical protein